MIIRATEEILETRNRDAVERPAPPQILVYPIAGGPVGTPMATEERAPLIPEVIQALQPTQVLGAPTYAATSVTPQTTTPAPGSSWNLENKLALAAVAIGVVGLIIVLVRR